MATFNRAHLILETINSIRNQTFKEFECLIIDDGSEDNTENLLYEIARTDPRLIFDKRPKEYKKGLPGCRNYGLDICRGAFIMFCDDDDILHSNCLKYTIDLILTHQIDFIHFRVKNFISSAHENIIKSQPPKTYTIEPNDVSQIISRKINLISCSVLWSKKFIGGKRFNESIQFAEEFEFYLRLLTKGPFRGLGTNQILYFARKHEKSMTNDFHMNNSQTLESYRIAVLITLTNLKSTRYFSFRNKKILLNLFHSLQKERRLNSDLSALFDCGAEFLFWKLYLRLKTQRLIYYDLRKRLK